MPFLLLAQNFIKLFAIRHEDSSFRWKTKPQIAEGTDI